MTDVINVKPDFDTKKGAAVNNQATAVPFLSSRA